MTLTSEPLGAHASIIVLAYASPSAESNDAVQKEPALKK
jgi:hypothetical protein